MTTTTIKFIAKSLKRAVDHGGMSLDSLAKFHEELMDAAVALHVDAEENGDRRIRRSADVLNDLLEEIEEVMS